jgi:hypothetical protein
MEDPAAKASTTSFMTTGRSETRPDSPIAYDDLYREPMLLVRQEASPTMLLQIRARSKSLGMLSQQTSESTDSASLHSPTFTPPRSLSVSSRSSIEPYEPLFPDIPTPPYDEADGQIYRLRHVPSLESLQDREVENDYLPPPRHPIRPKPEEGQETLPDYSCSVFRSAIVNRKVECVYPGLPAKKREWVKVYCIILGTVLRVYLIQPDGSVPNAISLDHPYRDYTMQYAEAGIASDYVKRKYVLRVRAEGEQFLMQCPNEEERDAWVEAVQAGSSIALALEDRNMPKYVTLPRRRRARYLSSSVSRSRPIIQRPPLSSNRTVALQTVQSAPTISITAASSLPPRAASCIVTAAEMSASGHCSGEPRQDMYIDSATALALCLDAGRSRPHARERILISMLTARQHRQNEWVIINGVRRKINPKTSELEDPLPEGADPEEDEHRARLIKSKQSFSSRLFKMF